MVCLGDPSHGIYRPWKSQDKKRENKEICESREMSEVVFMHQEIFPEGIKEIRKKNGKKRRKRFPSDLKIILFSVCL
jgi:hypothetical protein